jgi:hypothetical protein
MIQINECERKQVEKTDSASVVGVYSIRLVPGKDIQTEELTI